MFEDFAFLQQQILKNDKNKNKCKNKSPQQCQPSAGRCIDNIRAMSVLTVLMKKQQTVEWWVVLGILSLYLSSNLRARELNEDRRPLDGDRA